MRLKTDIWVAALVRRVFSDGGYAAVERRGAADAGAIFIRKRGRDGRCVLYAPAPQSVFMDGEGAGDRVFEPRLVDVDDAAVAEFLVREQRFDPDLWVVELEVADAARYLRLAPEG